MQPSSLVDSDGFDRVDGHRNGPMSTYGESRDEHAKTLVPTLTPCQVYGGHVHVCRFSQLQVAGQATATLVSLPRGFRP